MITKLFLFIICFFLDKLEKVSPKKSGGAGKPSSNSSRSSVNSGKVRSKTTRNPKSTSAGDQQTAVEASEPMEDENVLDLSATSEVEDKLKTLEEERKRLERENAETKRSLDKLRQEERASQKAAEKGLGKIMPFLLQLNVNL